MLTEFDDSQHFGVFTTAPSLTSNTGKMVRQSELTLAALRAAGVLDNMVDGLVPPPTDKLWLDKNSDPAVLKEWDSTGSSWAPVTFDRLFGRAIVTPLGTPTGSPNALIVAQPQPFMNNRLYSITPIADNSGPTTVQVLGVGTFPVRHENGAEVAAKELTAGRSIVLLFNGVAFIVLFAAASLITASELAVAASAQAVSAASSIQSEQESRAHAATNYHPIVAPSFIRTAGFASGADGGGALYKAVGSEPTHGGKFSITLDDGVTVQWYEIAETTVRPAMFGANLISGDQQAALQAMFAHGAEDIYLPPGVWRSDSDLMCVHDVTISGPGYLDFSNGSGQLVIAGSATAIDALSVDVSKGDRALTWAALPDIAVGDVIILYNPTDYSWGSRRDYYRDGAMFRVHSISGNNARVYGQAVDPYLATDFDIYRMNPVRVCLNETGLIGGTGVGKAPVKISFGLDCVIKGVRGSGGVYALIDLDRCFNTDVDASPVVNNSPVVDDEYGIIVANCHHTKIRGGGMYATRHPVALGGGDDICCVPTRDTIISDMTLFNYSIDAAAADAHGNCDFTKYVNCVLLSGASVGGRNVELVNTEIFDWPADATGYCYWASEIAGGTYKFVNCTLRSTGDGQTFAYLYLNLLGPGNGVNRPVETTMRDDLLLIIDGLTVISPNAGSLAKAVRVQGQNANKKINVVVTGAGIIWEAPQGLAFVYVDDDTLATISSDRLIVDKATGPSGAYLLYPTADIVGVPTRQMEQRGISTATTVADTLVVAGPHTYRYAYSKTPSGSMSVALASGAASGATAGQPASSKIYAISETSIRGAIVAPANFTAGTVVALHWNVGIAEI